MYLDRALPIDYRSVHVIFIYNPGNRIDRIILSIAAWIGYSWAAGIQDWDILIHSLYINTWDLCIPDSILPRYAPVGDYNDPLTYALSVPWQVEQWQLP